MTESTTASSVTPRRAGFVERWSVTQLALLLFAGALLVNLHGTIGTPLTFNDESCFAEATREMFERGDWIVPHFNGGHRFDKPPLAYWLQAAAFGVFGEHEFAARLPSVLSGAALTAVVFLFGNRFYSRRAGWWAAIISATSLTLWVQSKGATANMLVTFFTVLAFWSGAELGLTESASPRKCWWWIFWPSLALGFLAKGPVAWLPLIGLAAWRFWQGPQELDSRFRFVPGVALMLALILAWAIPALVATQGEFLRVGIGRHVAHRMSSTFEGHGPATWAGYVAWLPFYFLTLIPSLGLWGLWMPWLTRNLVRNKPLKAIDRWLLACIAVTFAVFTFGWTKLPHYTMAAVPLVALLLADRWLQPARSPKWLVGAALASFVLLTGASLAALQRMPAILPDRKLAEMTAAQADARSEFAIVGLNRSSLVWYFRKHFRAFAEVLDENGGPEFMRKPGPRFVIMPAPLADKRFKDLPGGWKRMELQGGQGFGVHGIVTLVVIIKP